MTLERGTMVTTALPGDLGKPRPAVVIQANEFIAGHRTVLVCPLTSFAANAPLFRPVVDPDEGNGLDERSEIMVDKTTLAKKEAIGSVIGKLAAADMARVEAGLIVIAGLRHSVLPIDLPEASPAEK